MSRFTKRKLAAQIAAPRKLPAFDYQTTLTVVFSARRVWKGYMWDKTWLVNKWLQADKMEMLRTERVQVFRLKWLSNRRVDLRMLEGNGYVVYQGPNHRSLERIVADRHWTEEEWD